MIQRNSDGNFEKRLSRLINGQQAHLLRNGLKGIEKESMRITPDGNIAQTRHPKTLGAALTHPHITTDYSEALLEFITPPFPQIDTTLQFLEKIQQNVYSNLENQLLLSTSMPCGISGNHSIPIAYYGSSNVGQMKHIYRVGLDHRYGRAMQAIAGIHFNYSIQDSFWPVFQDHENNSENLQHFISESYFDLIRNLKRFGWLILYLYGSSPALCKSFLIDRREWYPDFDEFDQYTFYKPFATSLRMSDIGYNSSAQNNLDISFNTLSEYVASLTKAIETPFPDYQSIGIISENNYRQLNANILQIENEYYSSVRPKQIAFSGEKPTLALLRRGIRYVELRSLDIGPFNPIGIDGDTLRFIEAFMLFCVLMDSPQFDLSEIGAIKSNLLNVAYNGRHPDLCLLDSGNKVKLKNWAMEICQSMRGICEILDSNNKETPYTRSLNAAIGAIYDSSSTPSARILEDMKQNKETFADFALRISKQHEGYFRAHKLNEKDSRYFKQTATESLERQFKIESGDKIPFAEFLSRYFSQ